LQIYASGRIVTLVRSRGETVPTELPFKRGAIELLILKTLSWGPMHGYAIAKWIQDTTDDALRVEEGSLYPALYRMEEQGLIESEWGNSENNRRAKFYRLTRKGRTAAQAELDGWLRLSSAVTRVLRAIEEGA
jgi:transcriptional regulator